MPRYENKRLRRSCCFAQSDADNPTFAGSSERRCRCSVTPCWCSVTPMRCSRYDVIPVDNAKAPQTPVGGQVQPTSATALSSASGVTELTYCFFSYQTEISTAVRLTGLDETIQRGTMETNGPDPAPACPFRRL
jgi:hypothetical protein